MKNLLALIDGSVYSESVCDHAAWLANRCQASVDIFHVLGLRDVSSSASNLSGSIGLGARTALLEELTELDAQQAKLAQKRGRAILQDAHARVTNAGVDIVNTRLRNSELIETLQEFEANTDCIVIGKRGEAADFDKLHLGSNLERVARSSSKPILVAARAFKPIQHLLIAFDAGASAIKAVQHIADNAAFKGMTCQLLTVGEDTPTNRQKIEGAAALLSESGYNVETNITAGHAEAVISKAAEEKHIDLLVMGAYGHSRIRNFIIGSTTTEMMRACKIPVMLFR